MTLHIYENFTDAYRGLLEDVYSSPEFVCAPRAQKIKEKLGVRFVITNPLARLPFIRPRDFAVNYIVAEGIWYFAGIELTEWISYYSKFWEKISDDGRNANSAYGARIFKPHKRAGKDPTNQLDSWTQWDWCIKELVNDNDSRRAVVHIRNPLDSRYAVKDVPCTLTLQFFLRDDKVHLCVAMRSSDLWLGIANDVPAFTLFQELMAIDLEKRLRRPIDVGTYTHISNSLHIYERNFKKVEEVIEEPESERSGSISMPKMPSAPPLEMLLIAEQDIRGATSTEEVGRHVAVFSDLAALHGTIERYWVDWIKVLASHRCGKLDDKDAQRRFLDETSWEGYHFFDR